MIPQTGPFGLLTSLGSVSKIVLIVLFLFSVIAWGIILFKWQLFRRLDREDQRFLGLYSRAQGFDDLRRHARRAGPSCCVALFLALMERVAPESASDRYHSDLLDGEGDSVAADRGYLERVAGAVLQEEMAKLEAYLPFLATTGNIAPFIGLLGTVLGIIDAFREIGLQGTASIAVVAPGVAEALVATAAGLFTAIPAVVGYNYFLSRIRRASFRAEAFGIECVNALLSRGRPVEVRK